MTFVHKDQGTISRCEVADLLQGCNVAIHGKGPVSGHQAQPMLLQGKQGPVAFSVTRWRSHPPSVLFGVLRAPLAQCQAQRWARRHCCIGPGTSSAPCLPF